MIKILEKGQTTFTRICDRCGCKFQYDLSDLCGLDFIPCPCCHTSLTHVGPKVTKIDFSKNNQIDFPTTVPYKIEVGEGRYNYATTTGEYINPNINTTISAGDIDPKSDGTTFTGGDPNAIIYANKLPDDIVDDHYNKIGSELPDDVRDDCMYRSAAYEDYYTHWKKQVEENKPIKCKKK